MMQNGPLTEAEETIFHFLRDGHQADFVAIKAKFKGLDVALLCWLDTEAEQVRPMAILANDSILQQLEILDMVLEKTVEDIPEPE